MVNTTGPHPPLPWHEHLVVYDQHSHRPIHSLPFQRGGARWIMLPAGALVKRWLVSRRLSHGVYFRLISDNPHTETSVRAVTGDSTGARTNAPLLLVQTNSTKGQLSEEIASLTR